MCGESHVLTIGIDLVSILSRDRGNAMGKLAQWKLNPELCKLS